MGVLAVIKSQDNACGRSCNSEAFLCSNFCSSPDLKGSEVLFPHLFTHILCGGFKYSLFSPLLGEMIHVD